MADLTVRKVSYLQPVSILGVDAQGRMVAICPQCHNEAVIEADGQFVCPTDSAISELLAAALLDLVESTELPVGSPLRSSRG